MPLCSQTKLLLNFDGANGSTVITDSSPTPVAVTAGGTDALSTAQLVAGTASFRIPDIGSFTADAAKLIHGSSEFSIECWARVDSTLNNPIQAKTEIWKWTDDVTGVLGLEFQDWDTNLGNVASIRIRGNVPDSGLVIATRLISMDTWYHLAMTRQISGGTETIRVFLNGVNVYQNTQATVVETGTVARFRLGDDITSRPLKGFMDEFRYVVGSPVYTANFNPPTQAVCDTVVAASTMSAVPVWMKRYHRRRK